MRDIMAEDFIAGLMRIAEAVLIGTGIAVGVMVPLSFFQSMLGTSGVCGDFLTCLYAAAGVLAFGVIFNLREKRLLLFGTENTDARFSFFSCVVDTILDQRCPISLTAEGAGHP